MEMPIGEETSVKASKRRTRSSNPFTKARSKRHINAASSMTQRDGKVCTSMAETDPSTNDKAVVALETQASQGDAKSTIGGSSTRSNVLGRSLTEVRFYGEGEENSLKNVNAPTGMLFNVAHISTRYLWFDVFWLNLVTFLTPAAFALLWFGAIPLGDADGDFKQRVVWVFVVNTGTYVFFSFMLVNIFLACLDGSRPWRPFKHYAPILLMNYVLQVAVIGTIVFVHGTFRALGLVAIAMTILATVMGLRLLPHRFFDCNAQRYGDKLAIFTKILIYFLLFWMVLVGYIIANGSTDSRAQGFLTVALTIITFIFKKIFLSLTDSYPIEVGMVISGLWLENIVDLFITLAYPTASEVGPTFAVIWVTRVAENIAYLGFQFDAWFKFRVWIKGKFKSEQGTIVEEDLDEDDRGHSNQHPGYRRRQMRFLIWKLLSQISSAIFFLTVIPVLRYGQNNEDYPYSEHPLHHVDVLNDEALDPFEKDTFDQSMGFAAFSIFTTICSGVIISVWMWHYHRDTLTSLRERYRYLIVSELYFGFVLTILISNVLLAVSAVQVNNRLYYI